MTLFQRIEDMSINPTGDHEAIIMVLKNDGDLKFVNENLIRMSREVGPVSKTVTDYKFSRQERSINDETPMKDYVFRLRRFFMRRTHIYLESATGDMK